MPSRSASGASASNNEFLLTRATRSCQRQRPPQLARRESISIQSSGFSNLSQGQGQEDHRQELVPANHYRQRQHQRSSPAGTNEETQQQQQQQLLDILKNPIKVEHKLKMDELTALVILFGLVVAFFFCFALLERYHCILKIQYRIAEAAAAAAAAAGDGIPGNESSSSSKIGQLVN